MQEDVGSDDELIKRAMVAYARRAGAHLPCKESSVEALRSHKCVVLRNGDKVLAVYIVEKDGKLKDVSAVR